MTDELPITGDNPLTTNIKLIHSLLVKLEDQLTGLTLGFVGVRGRGEMLAAVCPAGYWAQAG